MNMIDVNHVTMKFQLTDDKVNSLKEFMVALFEHRLKYNDFTVLEDIDFHVKKGEVVGIIGKNGAGKSTLLKIIAGVLAPSEGNVITNGNVVPMLELGSGFDQELSGSENIFLNGAILGYDQEFLKSKYNEIVNFSELEQFIHIQIRNYSSGMLMRLAFSIATVVEPEILIVDEILAVGDEGFQAKSKARMIELMSGGTTVLFVSHSLSQIEELCDRVIWLDNHKVKAIGRAKDICQMYEKYWNN